MEEKEIKKPIRVTYPQFDKVDIKEWQEALNKITDECFINANTTRTLKNIRETLDNNLSRKYGLKNGERKAVEDEILGIHGIREDNFDFLAKFSDFINNPHLNSTSIDDNANKTERNMKGVLAEISLPISKLIGYDYLYRVMCELYGKEKAKELSGSMYDFSLAINDSTGIMSPYCYCMDASKLVTVGRDFGKVHSRPAQRLATYISTLGDTIRELSFNLMGALAIGTFFLDSANLLIYKERVPLQKLKEDKNERKRISNLFQQFIYTVNHYSRNATESPFTNISCFDHDKLKNLIGPDNYAWYFQKKTQVLVDNDLGGEEYKITYEEWEEFIIDYIMTLQEIFIDVFDKGDPLQGGLQFPFPVTTCNISIEITKDGKRKIVQPNRLLNYITKKDISRYNIYDNEGTKMASCCLAATTKILYRINDKIFYGTVHQLYDIINHGNNEKVEIMGYKGFVEVIKAFEIKNPTNELIKITLKNGLVISTTKDHPSVKINKDGNLIELKAEELQINDILPVSKEINYESNGGSKELGRFVGLFGAEGQFDNRRTTSVSFCFHTQETDLQKFISDFSLNNFGCKSRLDISPIYENSCKVEIQGNVIHGLMKDFFIGELCTDKRLKSRIFNMSEDFKLGFLEGFIEGDGYTKDNTRSDYGNIHIANKELAHDLVALANSINIKCSIRKGSNGNDYIVNILHNDKLKLEPLSNWHNGEGSKQKSTVLNNYNDYYGVGIESIEIIKTKKDMNVYDFTVNTNDHLFQIANGIITHNCRLLSDPEEFKNYASSVNSFGGSSVSLGSCRVVTLNFHRAACEATSYEHFKQIIDKRCDNIAKILKAQRLLVLKMTNKGLHPFISNGWINFNRMFGTFGCIGYLEADQLLKMKFGNETFDYMKDFMIYFNQKCNSIFQEKNEKGERIYQFPYNIEQIPGESMAPKLAKVDYLIFNNKRR